MNIELLKNINIKVRTDNEDIIIPEYKMNENSGFDIRSSICANVEFGKVTKINTGLYFQLPSQKDTYPFTLDMQIRPRSGLAGKYGIFVVNGPATIDNNYRGELIVLLSKCIDDKCKFIINKGDRIAQAIISPVFCGNIVNFTKVNELDDTNRGTYGFGSSGIK